MNDFRQRCHQTAVVRKTLNPRWADPSRDGGGSVVGGSKHDGGGGASVEGGDADDAAETASFAWVVVGLCTLNEVDP